MKFSEWFEKHRSRAVELAQHTGVTLPAVYQWATNGVPIHRMGAVETFTKRAVRVVDMVSEASEFRARRESVK